MIQAGGEGCALTSHVTRRPGKLARKDQVKRNLRPRALWIKQSDSPLSLYWTRTEPQKWTFQWWPLTRPVLQASSAKLVYDTLMKTASDHRRHLVQDLRNGALAELVLAMWKEWNEPLSGLSVCDRLDIPYTWAIDGTSLISQLSQLESSNASLFLLCRCRPVEATSGTGVCPRRCHSRSCARRWMRPSEDPMDGGRWRWRLGCSAGGWVAG